MNPKIKRNTRRLLLALLALACLLMLGAFVSRSLAAQTLAPAVEAYAIGWSTFDSGGGASEGTSVDGDLYALSGTSGQPEAAAAPMTGGEYALSAGYWQPRMSEHFLFLPVVQR